MTREDLVKFIDKGTEGNYYVRVPAKIIEDLFKTSTDLDMFCVKYGYRRNLGRSGVPTNLEWFATDFIRDLYVDANGIERSWKTRQEWENRSTND